MLHTKSYVRFKHEQIAFKLNHSVDNVLTLCNMKIDDNISNLNVPPILTTMF